MKHSKREVQAEIQTTIHIPELDLSREEQDDIKRHISNRLREVIEGWNRSGLDFGGPIPQADIIWKVDEPQITRGA
jgi:hypothetical protein